MQGSGVLEIALDPVTNKTGDMWHVCVMGLRDIGMMCYGWRADGDTTWESECFWCGRVSGQAGGVEGCVHGKWGKGAWRVGEWVFGV